MKGLKAVLGIALSVSGLGTAVALGTVSVAPTNEMIQVNAAVSSCSVRGTLASEGVNGNWDNNTTFGTKNGNQYEKENVLVKTTDEFKFYVNNANWIGYDKLGNDSSKAFFNNGGNLKIKKDGYYNFYVQESALYVTNSAYLTYLVGLNGDFSIANGSLLTFNTSTNEHYIKISLTSGNTIKLCNTNNSWYGWSKIEEGSGSVRTLNYVTNDNDDNIVISHTGSYEIFLKSNGKIWMQLDSVDEATAWATSFISATGSICSSGGTNANHLSALSGIWSNQKISFDALTLGARNVLIAGTANATVADAHDRYVHIMTRYSGELDAFNGWMDNASPSRNIISFNSDNAVIVIVVASLMAIFATGLFFFIRKRRYN